MMVVADAAFDKIISGCRPESEGRALSSLPPVIRMQLPTPSAPPPLLSTPIVEE